MIIDLIKEGIREIKIGLSDTDKATMKEEIVNDVAGGQPLGVYETLEELQEAHKDPDVKGVYIVKQSQGSEPGWYYWGFNTEDSKKDWVYGGPYPGAANGSIDTNAIVDGAVTTPKIANGAATPEKTNFIKNGVLDHNLVKLNERDNAIVKVNNQLKKANNLDVFDTINDRFTARKTGGGILPTKYASINKIKGQTIVFNQLARNDGNPKSDINGISFLKTDDGGFIVNGTATATMDLTMSYNFPITVGHKYVNRSCAGGGAWEKYRVFCGGQSGTDDVGEGVLFTAVTDTVNIILKIFSGQKFNNIKFYPQVFDLTLMFGAGNEPTLEEFNRIFLKRIYPRTLKQIQNFNPSEIISIGDNLWNEEWETGEINTATGVDVPNSGRTRNKGYIDVYNTKKILVKCSGSIALFFYDKFDNFLSSRGTTPIDGNALEELPVGTRYVRWNGYYGYGNKYKYDICFSSYENDMVSNVENVRYSENKTSLDFNWLFPNGLMSVGNTYDEINSNGAIKRCDTRAYQEGDNSNANVVTDGVNTIYKLPTEEIIFNNNINILYNTNGFGIELVKCLNDVATNLEIAYLKDNDYATLMNSLNTNANFKIVAHRGLNSFYPENTILAFKKAKELGYNYIETDVQFTTDGYPVIIHDYTVDRTSNGRGKVRDLTFEHIRTLDFGSWKNPRYAGLQIPTFEEMLDCCKKIGIFPIIEIKAGTAEQVKALVAIVKKYGMNKDCKWNCTDVTHARAIVEADEYASVGFASFNYSDETAAFVNGLKNGKNEPFLMIAYEGVNDEVINKMVALDLPLVTWTINGVVATNKINNYAQYVLTDGFNIAKYLYNKEV